MSETDQLYDAATNVVALLSDDDPADPAYCQEIRKFLLETLTDNEEEDEEEDEDAQLTNEQCDCANCGKQNCDQRSEPSQIVNNYLEDITRTLDRGLLEPHDVPKVLRTMQDQGTITSEQSAHILENLSRTYPNLKETTMNRKPTPLGLPVHNVSPEESYRVAGESQTDLQLLIKKLLKAKVIDPMDAFLEPEDLLRLLRRRLDKLSPLDRAGAVANRTGPKPLGLPGF